MWKLKSGKTMGRRKILYKSPVYRNYRYVLVFFELGLDGRPKMSLSRWRRSICTELSLLGGWGAGEIRVTA